MPSSSAAVWPDSPVKWGCVWVGGWGAAWAHCAVLAPWTISLVSPSPRSNIQHRRPQCVSRRFYVLLFCAGWPVLGRVLGAGRPAACPGRWHTARLCLTGCGRWRDWQVAGVAVGVAAGCACGRGYVLQVSGARKEWCSPRHRGSTPSNLPYMSSLSGRRCEWCLAGPRAGCRCVVRDCNSGHQLLLPPANWRPMFAFRTTQAL